MDDYLFWDCSQDYTKEVFKSFWNYGPKHPGVLSKGGSVSEFMVIITNEVSGVVYKFFRGWPIKWVLEATRIRNLNELLTTNN